MSYSTENDPLLPRDSQSPGIQCSRSQSIGDVEEKDQEIIEDHRTWRKGMDDAGSMLLRFCLIVALSLGVLYLGSQKQGDQRPVPKTINQRVNRILESTPLIGTFICDKS
jgi:hypothetical protein